MTRNPISIIFSPNAAMNLTEIEEYLSQSADTTVAASVVDEILMSVALFKQCLDEVKPETN